MQYFGISRFAFGVVYACIPLRWYFPDNTLVVVPLYRLYISTTVTFNYRQLRTEDTRVTGCQAPSGRTLRKGASKSFDHLSCHASFSFLSELHFSDARNIGPSISCLHSLHLSLNVHVDTNVLRFNSRSLPRETEALN